MKALVKSSLREIRHSLGRYLAILAIVGLGVGFFAGLRMAQPSMLNTGVEYLQELNLYDFRLLSTLGFTDEDVAYFAGLDGISAAQGSVYTDFLWRDGDNGDRVLTAHALVDNINTPSLLAGRMPQSPNECLGDARYFTEEDLGRVLEVSPENSQDTLDLLAYNGYTLVGLMDSPAYLNFERGTSSIGSGSIAAFVYIPEEGFDSEAYYEIYLTLEAYEKPWTDAYQDLIDSLQADMEARTQERAELRYETLYSDAIEEIRDGEQELADGWDEYRRERSDAEQKLADAYQELTDGEQDYADGQRDYADGLANYRDGQRELEDARRELADGKAELDSAKAELDEAKGRLDGAKAELDEGNASYQQLSQLYTSGSAVAKQMGMTPGALAVLDPKSQYGAAVDQALQAQGSSLAQLQAGWAQAEEQLGAPLNETSLAALQAQLDEGQASYDAGYADYEKGQAAYEDGLAAYEEGLRKLRDGEAELAGAERELADARNTLADARRELDDGWKEYRDSEAEAQEKFADAERELDDGEAELADARETLQDLKSPDTYVLTRMENTGYACFESDTSIVAAISLVFPVFFFLVAALVCMTTMTRMVDEQRTQIGVLKALGYSRGQITGKYLFYSGSAALIGCLAGYALGAHWLPWIIWQIYALMYGFAPLEFTFDPLLAGISFVATLLCSMGATYLSCRSELKKPAAELIRPKAPKAGRRVFLEHITPIWRRLSFLRKVSVRNVLRYRSRLIMMVLGIGGCTALLITGFGLRDSIQHVVDDQYDQITLYDYAVSFQEPMAQAGAEAYLADRGWAADQGLLVHSGSVDVVAAGGSKSVYLVVSASDTLDGFISLHSGENPIPYPGVGEAVLNRGLAQRLDIEQGDAIQLRDEKRGTLNVTVSAICDNYVFNYVYVSPQTYADQGLDAPEYKAMYLLARQDTDLYEDGVVLADHDSVSSVTVNEATRQRVNTMLERMDLIVAVVVVCAAALAFIVLYNLTNINITERVREIATIKVLGFYQKETASYVFREIIMLSVLGSIVGLGMGKLLHAYVMAQVHVDGLFFPCQVAPTSYLISLAMTWLFTLIVSFTMRPKLRRIDMAESLKSIE